MANPTTPEVVVLATLAHLSHIRETNSTALLAGDLEPRTGDVDPDVTFVRMVAQLLELAQ